MSHVTPGPLILVAATQHRNTAFPGSPSSRPLRISTRSSSLRGVVICFGPVFAAIQFAP